MSQRSRHADGADTYITTCRRGGWEGGEAIRRGVPVIRIGDRLVTTVFDPLMAQYAVGRDGLPAQPTICSETQVADRVDTPGG